MTPITRRRQIKYSRNNRAGLDPEIWIETSQIKFIWMNLLKNNHWKRHWREKIVWNSLKKPQIKLKIWVEYVKKKETKPKIRMGIHRAGFNQDFPWLQPPAFTSNKAVLPDDSRNFHGNGKHSLIIIRKDIFK